jgi:hypothetical protein
LLNVAIHIYIQIHMLEVRVQKLENQLITRRRRPRRRTMMTTRKTRRPSHREEATTMAPIAPSDFPESSVSSNVPFASTIYMSTRTICSSTSKTSSWMKCRRPTWSNNIASFPGCSKQCLTCEDHELDVWCLLVLTFDVLWMNDVWWSRTLYDGWTWCMMPFGTYFWCMVDELCMMDNYCIYV